LLLKPLNKGKQKLAIFTMRGEYDLYKSGDLKNCLCVFYGRAHNSGFHVTKSPEGEALSPSDSFYIFGYIL